MDQHKVLEKLSHVYYEVDETSINITILTYIYLLHVVSSIE